MLSKKDVISMSNEQVLALVDKAKGHTGDDFKQHMDCDFTYSYLTSELKRRGYVFYSCWYLEGEIPATPGKQQKYDKADIPDIVYLGEKIPKENRIKTTVEMKKETWDRWKEMTETLSNKMVVLDAALMRFMDDFDQGNIEFRWKKK